MTHLERYDNWVKGGEAPGMSYERFLELAKGLGHSQKDIDRVVTEIRHWLASREQQKRANKRLFGRFSLNWLKNSHQNSYWQTGRLEPSDFGE